jgi:CHAT domain-containing protein
LALALGLSATPGPSRAAWAQDAVAADAIAHWSARLSAADGAAARTEALVRRGEAYRLTGRLTAALADLRRAVALAPNGAARAFAKTAHGLALAETGRSDAARDALAAGYAGATGQPAVRALAASHLARLALARDDLAAARRHGADAEHAARHAGAPLLTGVVQTTAGQIALAEGRAAAAERTLAQAFWRLSGLPRDTVRDQALLNLAEAAGGAPAQAPALAALASRAYADVHAGRSARLRALAAFGQARLHETLGARSEALAANARAFASAQATAAEDLLFRAAWQRARLLAGGDDPADALAAYRQAFASLQELRSDLPRRYVGGQSAYRRGFQQFHLAFVDLLLRSAAGAEPTLRQAMLAEARRVIEDLKIEELEDYFAERCVPDRAQAIQVDTVEAQTAVLYPIVLPDRLELLVSIGGRFVQRSTPIARQDLENLVRVLRFDVETYGRAYRTRAEELYRAMIAPVLPELEAAGVHTLVYVPDGVLRLVPIATLWDGERFLVERMAVATVLGLSLVDAEPFAPAAVDALVVGTTDFAEFAPLPFVADEVADLEALLNADVLFGDAFRTDRFTARLRYQPYDVVHVASHASFGARPADNFIAASNGRLNVERLSDAIRVRGFETGRPIELLTLSACSTAAGDDRAPLGLAGVAYRSGARSVLASLWPVFDAATAELMRNFYRGLKLDGVSRAAALRKAQVALLRRGPAYRHPAVWGAFVVIGNWR